MRVSDAFTRPTKGFRVDLRQYRPLIRGIFAELLLFVTEYLTVFVMEECCKAGNIKFTDGDESDTHFQRVQNILKAYASNRLAVGNRDHEIAFTDGLEGIIVHCGDGFWCDCFVIDELVAVGRHVTGCARINEFHALRGVEIFTSEECMTKSLSVCILSIVDEIRGILVCQFDKPVFVIINLCEPNTIRFLVLLSSFLSAFAFAFALSSVSIAFGALASLLTSSAQQFSFV